VGDTPARVEDVKTLHGSDRSTYRINDSDVFGGEMKRVDWTVMAVEDIVNSESAAQILVVPKEAG